MQKASGGDRWFPQLAVERRPSPKIKLTDGDLFHDELTRYKNHFLPLLKAEHAEEQRLFNERLREWSLTRLKKDGYAMTGLVARKAKWPAKQGGIVWEFRQMGANGREVQSMPFHRFVSGTTVILSRTNPLIDAVLSGGSTGTPTGNQSLLPVQVYSSGKGYIRIQAETEPLDMIHGKWRLDIGLNLYVMNVQKEAITSLNYDPIAQDVSDIRQERAEALERQVTSSQGEANLPEQTILAGTGLRDKLLRAFQQDFIPYESTTTLSTTKPSLVSSTEAGDGITIVNDGIVASQHDLKAADVDAVPAPRVETKMSGTLIRNESLRSWAERYRSVGEVQKIEGDPEVPLNPSQLRAIAMMISERLSLVQGPPGTGKTRVIIETIKLLKDHWQLPHPILVTAHTNVAVDNLVRGLRQHGVKAVRLGNMDRVSPDLEGHTFDMVARNHPLWADIEDMQSQLESIYSKHPTSPYLTWSIAQKSTRARDLRGRLHALRADMFSDLLLDADVICTTCLSAASTFILRYIDFPMVFLDEASMATEPLSLIPLMKGSSHVAIIGDHKQLPPVIISEAAKAGGLATSLFERLIHERHVPSIMLDTQYRMHPDISAFPSKTFYNSDLKDGTVDSDGIINSGFTVPDSDFLKDIDGNPTSMMFIDHDHPESPEMKSIANHGDARIICDIVADVLNLNPDLSGSDIGIIAPYSAQIRAIDEILKSDPVITNAMADILGPLRAQEVQDIEIKTVDGFEGREKQVIIFSAVRCNDAGYIGFLADWRRLNVAITRAKRGLIMVGSASTLEQARIGASAEASLPAGGTQVWKDFISHLRERGLIERKIEVAPAEEEEKDFEEDSERAVEEEVEEEEEEARAVQGGGSA